jgi:MYXO-CTERM domain-containing protein
MKKHILTLLAVLVLATGTVLMAQTNPNTTLPPSQQVDPSGEPETGTVLPDVDVDAGANAEDGLVDVEVDQNTDSDTAAQGNDNTNNLNNQTGTRTGTATQNDVDVDMDTDVDTTGTYGETETDNDSLPDTASNTPLTGLLGLLALAGAFLIRSRR